MAGDNFWKDHWTGRSKRADQLRREGLVAITYVGSRVQVISPYHEDFARRAKELGGRWKYRSKVWSFPGTSIRLVLELIAELYGKDAVGPKWAGRVK